MSVKWEKQEGNQGLLTIEVSTEEVNKALDKAFKKIVVKINEPGFRKGKMPRPLFEKKYGVEALYQDALEIIIPDAYSNAIDEAGIEPVDYPEIAGTETFEKGKDFTFTATVTVKPEPKLGEYKGLEVTKLSTEVTDEEVEEQIQAQLARKAELEIKEDGAVEEGDTAVIDFEGFLGEEAFEGGKGEDYALEIGSGSFIPGFEEQLVGVKAGESKDVVVTFPEEYHAAELAGKEATFKVTVKEIKVKELPELDDDFAKDVSEFDTFEAYKNSIKEKLDKSNEARTKAEFENKLVEAVCENAEIDIPQCMIDNRIEDLIREFSYRLSAQGLNMEQYMQITGATVDTFKEQFKDQAQAQVKSSLVLEKIVKLENIEVTEEDVEKELQTMADMYDMELDEVKTLIGDNEKESMKEDLKMKKAVELIAENAKVGKSAAKKTTAKKPAAKAADKKEDGEKAPAKKAPAKKTTAAKSTTAKKTTTKAKKDEE